MATPLFNYSPNLLAQVNRAGILHSDQSILQLNCSAESRSSEQRRALDNFEQWKAVFLDNCNGLFYSASAAMINANEKTYRTDLLSAMLIAELYDWREYVALEGVNSTSIFVWEGDTLHKTRSFSELI